MTETGLDVHSIYGVPYLKGSAIKGMFNAWCYAAGVEKTERERIFGYSAENEVQDKASSYQREVIFHDCFFPQVKLIDDIMTPHYGQYYQKQNFREDDTINPLKFKTISFPKSGQLILSLTDRSRFDQSDLDRFSIWLGTALEEYGLGAKTALGYGRFKLK